MLDETKGTPKDESTTGTPKKDETKGTPKDKGKLYTVAEIATITANAAAMGQGREKKVADQEKVALTQELESIKARFDALEREANETRLTEIRGDPAKLNAFQRDQAVTKREREWADKERDLTSREAQLKLDREAVDADKSVVSVAYLAAKHGLATEELEELGISNPEVLEKVAVKLAAAKPAGTPLGEGEEIPSGEAPELIPDSGEGTGAGAEPLTTEGVEAASVASVEKALEKASK